jgi:hypothetical protein
VPLGDDINNTVLELGLTYTGPDNVREGSLLPFKISDRSRSGKYDADKMAEVVLELLLTSPYDPVRKAAENAAGVVVE